MTFVIDLLNCLQYISLKFCVVVLEQSLVQLVLKCEMLSVFQGCAAASVFGLHRSANCGP